MGEQQNSRVAANTAKQIQQLSEERFNLYRAAGKSKLREAQRERLTEINRLLPMLWDRHRRELALNARPENDMGRPGDGWWARREVFGHVGRCQSSTEASAMLRLRHQAVRTEIVPIETREPTWDDVFDDWGMGILREVLSELKQGEIREAV